MTVIVIYGDFNCPYSYLASLRSDLFSAAGVEIDWRAVEHASSLPVMGQRLDDAGQRKIADELDSVRQLLTPEEAFAAATPSTLPNTAAANAGYAEAVGSEVGDDVRRLLFDAYWGHGTDIGSVDVLELSLAVQDLFTIPMRELRRAWSATLPERFER